MRKPVRLASARDWVRSGAQVTVGTYAKRYGVDRYTAYDELTAIGFALPATASRWARRPPPVPRKKRRRTDDRRMLVVGYTAGGAPFGVSEDELEDSP